MFFAHFFSTLPGCGTTVVLEINDLNRDLRSSWFGELYYLKCVHTRRTGHVSALAFPVNCFLPKRASNLLDGPMARRRKTCCWCSTSWINDMAKLSSNTEVRSHHAWVKTNAVTPFFLLMLLPLLPHSHLLNSQLAWNDYEGLHILFLIHCLHCRESLMSCSNFSWRKSVRSPYFMLLCALRHPDFLTLH